MNDDIRNAAKKRDWGSCKEALIEKFTQIEQNIAAKICLTYFEDYMSRLLDEDENSNWLANRLSTIQKSKLFSENGNNLPPFPDMDLKFNDVKLRTVKWALFDFWSGALHYTDTRLTASNLSEAVASMITVFRLEHPIWIPHQYDTEFTRVINSQEFCEFVWIQLADMLQ